MKTIALLAFAATLTAVGTLAVAQENTATTANSLADAIAILTARGLSIQEVERKGDGWEIESRTGDGVKIESYLDARTGALRDERRKVDPNLDRLGGKIGDDAHKAEAHIRGQR